MMPMTPEDPLQQKMMMLMPVIFTVMFVIFLLDWCCTGW